MNEIDVDDLSDPNEERKDYRRANGAPLVSDPENPDKTLRYSRPSSYGKNLDDENALVNWRIWKAMEGVAASKSLAAQVAATPDEDKVAKKELREKALDKGTANEAADMGTALHAMTARIENLQDMWEAPEQYQADLNAYMQALDEFGLVSEMVEVHMVNDAFRAAGTADRIYRLTKPLVAPDGTIIEAGELVLGDLKTGKSLDFSAPGYCIQTAIYATGELYDIHLEKRLPTPPINLNWALLVHLPVGKAKCEMVWCSIELGIHGAELSRQIKEWQAKWKGGRDGHDVTPVEVYEPLEAPVTQRLEEGGIPNTVEVDVPLEEVVAYCHARVTTIAGYEKAKESLILWWPEGLPTPKSGKLTNPDDIVKVLNLLDKVEKDYSIPFMHTDPRRTTGHKDQVDRSNERGLVDSK